MELTEKAWLGPGTKAKDLFRLEYMEGQAAKQ
jgi:hypothetical protein